MKTELIKWMEKTFGKQRHGDRVELVEIISEKVDPKAGIKYLITEINLVIQRVNYEPSDVTTEKIAKWRVEIDEISGQGIVKFFSGDMKNLNLNAKPGIMHRNELEAGKSFLLQVNIFNKRKIGVTLVTAKER